MAAPQKEHGFSPIAHEVLEAVMSRKFSGTQWAILAALWRETWGWGRIEAGLSLGLLQRQTGIKRHKCLEILVELVELQVIVQVDPGNQAESVAATYRFQKDYELWQVGVRGDSTCSPTGEHPRSLQGNTPRSLQGNTSKKGFKESYSTPVPLQGNTPPEASLTELRDKAQRRLQNLQIGNFPPEDRELLTEILRQTQDKSPQRVLEAVDDAIRETQLARRQQRIKTPIRFALRIVGRVLSEPEPSPVTEPKYFRVPEDWQPPPGWVAAS